MADYCQVADITAKLKSVSISDSTKITTANVEDWITKTTNMMNGYVVKQLALPVTDTEALSVLEELCAKLVCAEFVRVNYAGATMKIPAVAKEWHDEAMRLLREIAKGTFKLTSADSSAIVHTGTEDADGNTREPNIGIETEF